MIDVAVTAEGGIRASYSTELPISAEVAWRTLSDFRRMVCLDRFHACVDLHGESPGVGVEFDLPHRALGFCFARRGRILKWIEGRGYAFSDLSSPDPQRVFPHVFEVSVDSVPSSSRRGPGGATTQLRLGVRGRWTALWLPRWAICTWVVWNVWLMGVEVANELLAGALSAPASGGLHCA